MEIYLHGLYPKMKQIDENHSIILPKNLKDLMLFDNQCEIIFIPKHIKIYKPHKNLSLSTTIIYFGVMNLKM